MKRGESKRKVENRTYVGKENKKEEQAEEESRLID